MVEWGYHSWGKSQGHSWECRGENVCGARSSFTWGGHLDDMAWLDSLEVAAIKVTRHCGVDDVWLKMTKLSRDSKQDET